MGMKSAKPSTVWKGLVAALVACFVVPAVAKEDVFAGVISPLFQEHCVRCHGEGGKVKGKVNLLEVKDSTALTSDTGLLKDLIDVLDYEEMPPEDEPQPASEVRRQVMSELRELLHATLAAKRTVPRTPIRRMNRFQYANAVKDLFGLNVKVFSLPEEMAREHGGYFKPETGKMPDKLKVGSRPLGKSQMIEPRLAGVGPFPQDLRAEHGYDTQADHLSMSPLLMESFLTLSRSVVESPDFNNGTVGIWQEFFVRPGKGKDVNAEVRERLKGFLLRAFRRPVDDALLDRYAGHAIAALESGEDFTETMKVIASAALASPRFLYLYDGAGGEGGVEPLDDFELASRLSFFLWGSVPDAELLKVASEGKLTEPKVLDAQVDRMLKDHRLKRFCDSFPSQWLQLDRIISSVPNETEHPDFYFAKYRTSMHMMLEPLLLFETILIENRPILELIDSDYSYRSRRLQNWYGHATDGKLSGPTTIEFMRVPVTSRREGGVITSAAVLTMTSGPNHTKPITRGAWVTGVIFNDPPEPPPADVPPLEEDEKDVAHLTIRERFAAHRDRPDCAGCHAQLDPLGFALENYDKVGRWRDKYENGREVDASGVLFRKYEFKDVVEFKDAILQEKDRFTRGFAGHLLAFALGREVEAEDSIALDQVAAKVAADGYRMKTLIKEIVRSEPFLSKSNPKRDLSAAPGRDTRPTGARESDIVGRVSSHGASEGLSRQLAVESGR